MRIVSQSLARGIRAISAQWRRPVLLAMTLSAVAVTALTPATTQAQPAGPPPTYQNLGNVVGSELASGQSLAQGQALQSPNGKWRLVVLDDQQPEGYSYRGVLFLARHNTGDYIEGGWDTNGWLECCWTSYDDTNGWSNPVVRWVMQTDGNFVAYQADNVVRWSTGTQGHPGAKLVLRDDGNVIIVDAYGHQIWATNTVIYTPAAILSPGQKLTTGQELRPSPDAQARLLLQPDGNLVLYRISNDYQNGKALWASNTQGKPMTQVTMQTDGNFVGRGPDGKVYWRTVTYGHPGAFLVLRADGNLLVTDQAPQLPPQYPAVKLCCSNLGVTSGKIFWQTNTIFSCTPFPPPSGWARPCPVL
jgi:hypothetical protein